MTGEKRTPDRLVDFWVDHRSLDWVVPSVLVMLHVGWVWITGHGDVLGWLSPTDRRGLYSAGALIVSLLGSTAGVAIGQLASAKGDRATAMKKQGGEMLANTWRGIFLGALLAALLALAALATEPSEGGRTLSRWLFELSVLFAVAKFLRLASLFAVVLSVAARDSVEGDGELPEGSPVGLAERWKTPA